MHVCSDTSFYEPSSPDTCDCEGAPDINGEVPPCSHSYVRSNPLDEYAQSWCEWCGDVIGGDAED